MARKLIANGEKGHKLNFPDDHTEVYSEVTDMIFYEELTEYCVSFCLRIKTKKEKDQRNEAQNILKATQLIIQFRSANAKFFMSLIIVSSS